MPTVKCGGCAKFISPPEAAKCKKCNCCYHRVCVELPITGPITPTWNCPECTKCTYKDKSVTPLPGSKKTNKSSKTCSGEYNIKRSCNDITVDSASILISDFTNELKLFKEDLREELRQLRVEFKQLHTEITQLKDSLKNCDERVSSLETKMEALEQKVVHNITAEDKIPLEKTVAELKLQLNERDQELLLNDVVIAGIPEQHDESTLHHLKVLSTKLGVNLEEIDVVHIERLGSTRRNRVEIANASGAAESMAPRPRDICVRFARRRARDALIQAARVRRGLTTDNLGLAGPPRRIYVNERLTNVNRNLFYRARQAGFQYKWRYIWTRDGKIFARKEDGYKLERIRHEDDIQRIFG